MKHIKFGLAQITKATPTIVGRIKRALNFINAGILIYLPILASKLNTTPEELAQWIGFIIFGYTAIAMLFGVDLEDVKVVKAEDVTEVKTD